MVLMKFTFAALAASLLPMAFAANADTTDLAWTSVITHIPSATVRLPASAMTSIGCFETGIPLQNYGDSEYQTEGECQFICLMLNKNVMGLSDGVNCWCGDKIPAEEWQVSNSSCSTTCSGYDEKTCRSTVPGTSGFSANTVQVVGIQRYGYSLPVTRGMKFYATKFPSRHLRHL